MVGSDVEIMESDSAEKRMYTVLLDVIRRGNKMMDENPNIRQINIYSIHQGGRNILAQSILSDR